VKTDHRGKFIYINDDIKNSEHMLCNPRYLGNGDRRIMVYGWSEKKHETLSEKKSMKNQKH
jgi:hypothetical protein